VLNILIDSNLESSEAFFFVAETQHRRRCSYKRIYTYLYKRTHNQSL
jgi:hypothetical protein